MSDSAFETIKAILCERLACPPADVAPETRLFDDLGADSLDLLDLLFTMEKRFTIRLRDSELDRLLRGDFGGRDQGPLSQADIKRLAEWLPSLGEVQGPLYPADLFSHITVASLARVVEKKRSEVH